VIRDLEHKPGSLEQPKQAPGDHPSPPGCASIDRRRETRYPTNDAVEILLLEAGGGPPIKGKALDVSRGGLRLELPTPVGKGLHLKIVLPDRTIIFGETRYCRHVSPLYHIGIAIEVVYYAQPTLSSHIEDAQMNLYALGQGLTAVEAIYVKNHLLTCGSCQGRLVKAQPLGRLGSEEVSR
jgi:hypothetical protein